MLRIIGAAILVAFAGASFSQTQPYQTTPSAAPATPNTAPTDTPAATPSPAPVVTPSPAPTISPPQTTAPSVTPSTGAPIVGGPAVIRGGIEERPIVGLSKCENLLAFEKEKCMQEERVAASAGAQPAGTGGTQNPAPTGTGR